MTQWKGPIAARARAERIRTNLSAAYEELAQAYRERDWEALGYASWDEYREAEFGTVLTKIANVETRTDVHRALSDAGMSQRQIAKSTGSSQSTVSRDLDEGDSFGSLPPLPADIAEQVRAREVKTREHEAAREFQTVRSSAQSIDASLTRAVMAMNEDPAPIISEYLDDAITALEHVSTVLDRLRLIRDEVS